MFFQGNSTIALILVNFTWEAFIILREFMRRIFSYKKESETKISGQPPLVKPIPAFESPLKDSYFNSSALKKENTK